MKKQYKIQLPKGKKVTMTNVDFEDGVMTVNVELENRKEQKYEPKDGDFVCYNGKDTKNIAIFKEKLSYGSIIYCVYNTGGKFHYNTNIIEECEIRPATEREKKILVDQLAKVNKKWNPETKSIENLRWRAGICCLYYYINSFGYVEYNKRLEIFDPETIYSDEDLRVIGYTDDKFYNSGNYFKTREAAEKAAEQIREILKNSKAE